MKRIPTRDDLHQLFNGLDWIYDPDGQFHLIDTCDFSKAEIRSAIPYIMKAHSDGGEYQKALKAVQRIESYLLMLDMPPGAV